MTTFIVDRHSGTTLYSQISRILEQEIKSCYEPGDAIPSEHELAQRFAVNRHTVRHAIDELVDKGMLDRQRGKGTFVLEAALDYSIAKGTRFTESIQSRGMNANATIKRKLLIPAGTGVARRLDIEEDATVILVDTLRQVENKPFCIISHFIPMKGFEIIYEEYDGGSLHGFINKHLNISLQRNESLVTASLPQGDDATLLKMPQQMPVLRVKSVNINTVNKTPVEYALTRFRSDRIQLSFRP